MNRKDLLNIMNAGEEKYVIDEIYDQVELDVEVTMSIVVLFCSNFSNKYL